MGDGVDFKLVTSGFTTFLDYAAAETVQAVIQQVGILDPFPRWALDLLLKRGKIYSET